MFMFQLPFMMVSGYTNSKEFLTCLASRLKVFLQPEGKSQQRAVGVTNKTKEELVL